MNGICEMLVMDFGEAASLGAVMDEDTAALIAQLTTRVGMIMEDASVVALTIGRQDAEARVEQLEQLQRAANQIGHLVQAALVLADIGHV